MDITKIQEIELPAAFDAHVHLRDGEMSQLVTPTIRKGGVNTVYVMVRFVFHYLMTMIPDGFITLLFLVCSSYHTVSCLSFFSSLVITLFFTCHVYLLSYFKFMQFILSCHK